MHKSYGLLFYDFYDFFFLNVLVNCSFKKKAVCTEQCFTPIQEDLGMFLLHQSNLDLGKRFE